jgi:hypothetical protein
MFASWAVLDTSIMHHEQAANAEASQTPKPTPKTFRTAEQ